MAEIRSAGAVQRKRRRRFVGETKLPTPPPEPGTCNGCTFQQLDRLHSLVEQVLELRSKNARLFRRVRELERVKALRRLELGSSFGLALPVDEGELAFAESLLGSLLESAPSATFPAKTVNQQPSCRLQRSRSIGTDTQPPLLRAASSSCNNKRSSCHLQLYESHQSAKRHSIAQAPCSPKVSKWTKVKAAFRWERAAAAFLEQDRFLLRPPVNNSVGPVESPGSGPPSPGALSSSTASSSPSSSTDELQPRSGSGSGPERRRINDSNANRCAGHALHTAEIRPVKTAWAMVKDMIQSRRERTNRASIRCSDDGYSLSSSLDSSADTLLQESDKIQPQRLTPSLTITLPSNEELRGGHLPSPTESNDNGSSPTTQLLRQDSKWNKVKRAFLSGSASTASVPASPSSRISSAFFDDGETGRSCSASVEDLEKSVDSNPNDHHQILNDKLSEWEKRSGKNGSPKDKDSANAILMGEEQLTPEFKKKLQEWKRMKKTSSGTTSPEQHQHIRRRLTDWQIWRTASKTDGKTAQSNDTQDNGKSHLSEEFLRKMDEWKKIKSSATTSSVPQRSDEEQSGCNTLSSNLRRQRSFLVDDKEFEPLDNVISMIEREQKFIAKQRQKLLDNKSRLSEIDRICDLTSDNREVLVRTSTGFYRFQGISQEFTRKLYEWEKSQGIAPEYSTLQLLNPAFRISSTNRNDDSNRDKGSQTFKRSKSMSSVVENILRDNSTPIRQPSSLSLNDATNLENDAKLRIDSKQTIGEEEMSEDLMTGLDDSEPEAVIVDIEDVIEETASPMAKFQPQQTPVYCVTASETTSIAIPLGTVTASHEPSPVILIQAGEMHHRIRKHRISHIRDDELAENTAENGLNERVSTRDTPAQAQIRISQEDGDATDDNRKRLYEPSDIKICETIIEVEEASASHIEEESNPGVEMGLRENTTATSLDERTMTNMQGESSAISDDTGASTSNMDESHSSDKTEGSCSVEASSSGNEVVITVGSEIRQRKVLKTRRLTDTQVGYKWHDESSLRENEALDANAQTVISPFPETPSVERIIINESTLNKIVVPTASNEQIAQIVDSSDKKSTCVKSTVEKSESRSVFVKTKRIIFSPFSRRSRDVEQLQASETSSIASSHCVQQSRSAVDCSRPPLPQSPILCRKDYRGRSSPKETAPSIRMMIQRYNQKLQEDAGSPASSGSGSPIWRSPSSERRVRTQMERYQEEVRRAISPHCRNALLLEKSASAELVTPHQIERRKNSLQNKNPEIFSSIKQSLVQEFKTLPISSKSSEEVTPPLRLRAQRIKKAKDEFLSRGPSCYSHDPSMQDCSGSSLDDLAGSSKFSSAGMINVDPGTFERLRQSKTVTAEFTGTLSKIASKFRRAKLKKVKEKEKETAKMGTVSMLCRQSLLVDILQPVSDELSKSCPTSPSPSQKESVDEHSRFKQHRDSN